jgi:hypothetical protein
MAYVDFLTVGQIDTDDTKPINYSSDTGYYVGQYFEGEDYRTAIYEKSKSVSAVLPVNQYYFNQLNEQLSEFIRTNYSGYILPTLVEGKYYIGFSHLLDTSEVNNLIIAFDDNGIIPLEEPRVAKIIRNNHPYLKGTTLVKDGKVDYDAFINSIAVYDESNNLYVYSLVNGARPEFIQRLLKIDMQVAYNIVTDAVKVPVTYNQFMALCSLAYDIGKNKFRTSKVVKALNSGDYHAVATYFMEFVEVPRKKSAGVSGTLYKRRTAEVRLFSSI